MKIVKQDGSFVYSSIKQVMNSAGTNLFLVAPNPVENELTIKLPSSYSTGEVKILLSNSYGQIVREVHVQSSNILKIPVRTLASGIYGIRIVNKNFEQLTGRFVKH
ncbi:MAG: T9SS type A sorting domain-containing protein [Bacteroidetes bacterium]|nr:T9SS type A sorting domain-containing protein [Bacteroidota bacterium]